MIAYAPHAEAPAGAVPADVRLVRVDLAAGVPLGDPFFDVLSDDERAAASRFLRPADALRSAATRAVLRRCLADELGRPAAALRFVRSARGRPGLDLDGAPPPLDFNVAHGGDHALVAWSRLRRVGVDVERRRPGWDWRPLARMVLGAGDARRMEAETDGREALFYDAWVAKEALLKAEGRGITDGLNGFSVLSDDPCAPRVAGEGAVADGLRRFAARWLRGIPGHAACLAWDAGGAGP